MYDYDRRTAAERLEVYDYQRVVASSPEVVKKSFHMISTVVTLADDILHALKFNGDVKGHDQIEKTSTGLVALAKWMLQRREVEAEPVARFAKLADRLAEMTKFWNRPAFLNKDRYVEEIDGLVKTMKKARQDVVKAFKLSGAWAQTRMPTVV